MRCSRVRYKLMAYVSTDLMSGEAQQIERHLASCDRCRAELESVQKASEALGLLSIEEPSPDLILRVRDRLSHAPERHRAPSRQPTLALSGIIVICIVIIIGWLMHGPGRQRSIPVAERGASRPSHGGVHIDLPPSLPATAVETSQPVMKEPSDRPFRAAEHHKAVRYAKRRAVHPRMQNVTPPAPQKQEAPLDESFILIIVTPREPESYSIKVNPDDGSPPIELSVVRKFDLSGNVTSVTIDNTVSQDDSSTPEAPTQDNGRLIDLPPVGAQLSKIITIGGNTGNA